MSVPNQQWTYVMINHADGEVVGTDKEIIAKAASEDPEMTVINVKTCQQVRDSGDSTVMAQENIPEQNWFAL